MNKSTNEKQKAAHGLAQVAGIAHTFLGKWPTDELPPEIETVRRDLANALKWYYTHEWPEETDWKAF